MNFKDFFEYIKPFSPIKFIVNDHVVYNDYDSPKGEYDDWERVVPNRIFINEYKITSFTIKIVSFHHSIVYINCERA